MIISVHDSTLNRVCYIDNTLPNSLHYSNDSWNRYLTEATSTFDFEILKTGNNYESFLNEQNYVSFTHDNVQYIFSIMRTEESEGSIKVYAENLNLELINEIKQPFDITTAQNLLWYLNYDGSMVGSGITVGINEVSDQTRKIKLESEQTTLARLISIANNFGAEIEFVTSLNPDGTLKSLVANFYKKYDGITYQGVGKDRQDIILEYGRNIDTITRTVDKTDVFNAIVPVGKDGIGIESIERTEYDADGNVEYYTKKGSKVIYSPISKQLYKAQLANENDGWIQRYHTLDGTSDAGTLYTLGLNELRKHAYASIKYEVTGYYQLNVGDTVRIVDNGFSPVLILKARVIQQAISFTNPSQNKTIFGNFQELENKLSTDITSRLEQLVDAVAPYRFEIVSDNGLTFKNSTGQTTLTARVFKGAKTEEVAIDSFEWLIDGVIFGGTGKSQQVTASQIKDTSVVRYNAKVGDAVIGGLEVTLQDVSDGKQGVDGKPTGITQSDTEPKEIYEGMLWQYTGEKDLPVAGTTAVAQATYISVEEKWEALGLPPENIDTPKLSLLAEDLGEVKAGSYTSWTYSDNGAYKYLNAVYMYNGRTRSMSIENPSTSNPDTELTNKPYLIRGTDLYGGMITTYNNAITTSLTPNEILKGVAFFITSNQASVQDTSRDASGKSCLDIRSDNVRFTGDTRQTNPWIKVSSLASYRVAFGTVTVSVGLTNGSGTSAIYLGNIPKELRPLDGRMFFAGAWWADNSRDRHFQINADDGNISLLSPYPGQLYKFEVTWTIPI